MLGTGRLMSRHCSNGYDSRHAHCPECVTLGLRRHLTFVELQLVAHLHLAPLEVPFHVLHD